MATLKPSTGTTSSGSSTGTGENQQDPNATQTQGDAGAGDTGDAETISMNPLAEFEQELVDPDENREPIACFKHKRIRRFSVGEFEFRDHFLYLYDEDSVRRFAEAWKGLMPIDKTAIVAFNWKAAQDLERPLESRALREGVSTYNIKDPKVVK